MKKTFINLIICMLCVTLLCGCTVKVEDSKKEDNNTNSNTTTEQQTTQNEPTDTTSPTAKVVAGLDDYSTKKVVWGPGNIQNHQQPADPVSLQKQFSSMGAKWLLDNEKSVCLTFDEGYENGFTPSILDTLKEKKVSAVFFVTYDFTKDNPKLIRRMIDEGHVVGNHSYRHYTMDEVSIDTAKEEVTFLHNYIRDKFNYTMSYFRFPKGEFSQQSLAIVHELKYKSVFWSYAYADWNPDEQPDPTKAFTGICESTHPGEILLLHAVSKTNADILGKVIDDIRSQGYKFTVDV